MIFNNSSTFAITDCIDLIYRIRWSIRHENEKNKAVFIKFQFYSRNVSNNLFQNFRCRFNQFEQYFEMCEKVLRRSIQVTNFDSQRCSSSKYFVFCQTFRILCEMMKKSTADLSQTIRDKKKCLIFCQMFDFLIFVYFVFFLLNVRIEIINAIQSVEERQRIIDEFNRKKSKLMILIMIYVVAFVELNLQYDCWRIHVFEIAIDLNILKQTIERIVRLKNFNKIVYFYEYVIKNIFDDKTIMRNINKTISQIMIELNRSIFHDDKKKITKNMKIEDWIKHKNKIYFYEKAFIEFDEFFQIMTLKKLIIVIMKNVKKKHVIDDDEFSIACWKKHH